MLRSEHGQRSDFLGVNGPDGTGDFAALLVAVADDDHFLQSRNVRIQLYVDRLVGGCAHLFAAVTNEGEHEGCRVTRYGQREFSIDVRKGRVLRPLLDHRDPGQPEAIFSGGHRPGDHPSLREGGRQDGTDESKC